MDYGNLLRLAAPETIVVIAAFLALTIDLLVVRAEAASVRWAIGSAVGAMGCAAAIFCMVNLGVHEHALNGMLVVDGLTTCAKAVVLGLAAAVMLISRDAVATKHIGEYFALMLLATAGMLFMVSSEELLMIFLSLELTSLCLYVLAAFHQDSPGSTEAGLKYFLFGGMSAAFALFGFSYLYGISGTTALAKLGPALARHGLDPLIGLGLVCTLIGFGFKVAAVPFHLWAPDAYQGAPTASAAWIASGSKLAAFFLLAKVMWLGFPGWEGNAGFGTYRTGWLPLVAVMSLISLGLGNLAALAQQNVKRLLAYSAIAHAGYTLVGLLGDPQRGMASVIYYAATYAMTALGAFAVVAIVEQQQRGADLSCFAGLSRRSPVLAFAMLIFLLSLAGIPPLAGFFGKFFLFSAALQGQGQGLSLAWLVAIAVGLSAVSVYYYFQVAKQMYVVAPDPSVRWRPVSIVTQLTIILLAAGVLVLGCAPNLLLGPVQSAIPTAQRGITPNPMTEPR